MSDPSHITVTAPPGRLTPVHRADGAEPGGALLCAKAGEIIRVRFAGSSAIRRSIARGDLVPCNMSGAAVGVHFAAAPNELPDGRVVIAERQALEPGKATP